MPPELIPDDEEYVSDEDSDFAPDTAPAPEADSSDEESEAEEPAAITKQPQPKKRKRGEDEEAEDVGFENSGDEAIMKEGTKSGRKKGKKNKEEIEDEGGEGGLVKTRSMRAQEVVEKKPLVNTAEATIDVDSVFREMMSGKPAAADPQPPTEPSLLRSPDGSKSPEIRRTTISLPNGRIEASRSPSTLSEGPDSMIMIKRAYNFAGKVHTEQKLVPRNSAEAKLFLATNAPVSETPEVAAAEPEDSLFTKPKRPLKKARRSIFEPVIEIPPRTDLYFGLRKQSDITLVGAQAKVKKFNTVEKSAMDWAGFVDKEGIADELDAAGKSKGAYKARQEFLARVEAKKVEDDRKARGLPTLL
ncbi:related to SWC5 Component of the Swr1p complex that incorporates Htz1p into chromatin [Rhynchosporium agropyri]|uniref:SWR1-complex protein 5 n=1 Tax=Rhynchosporium agropyri TaxID=914238 RepID=A0A1E1LQC8_9HELO|nr:related to SWC5 Component of the Swr1p complex that incorporates Htz1p into chromatin [Rhynchosporium agropyri]